jgi:hypothetical protein
MVQWQIYCVQPYAKGNWNGYAHACIMTGPEDLIIAKNDYFERHETVQCMAFPEYYGGD